MINNVTKSFGRSCLPILKGVTTQISEGTFCILIGANGSGKSTMMKAISGEYSLDSGEIYIDGNSKNRHILVSEVAQDIEKGTISELTLLENIALSSTRNPKIKLYSRFENDVIGKISSAGMGLEKHIHTKLSNLSGGQRQAIAMIMATASNPKLLLLDEHTSALDPNMQSIIMKYTADYVSKMGLTTIMITHNINDAIQYGDRLIMMHRGKIVFDASGSEKANLKPCDILQLFHKNETAMLAEGFI